MKTRLSIALLLALTVVLHGQSMHGLSKVTLTVLLNGSTNTVSAGVTNRYDSPARVAPTDAVWICIAASAKIVGIGDTPVLTNVTFVLAKGDGTIYESSPSIRVTVPISQTNVVSTTVTNFYVGAVYRLRLDSVEGNFSTAAYATNITVEAGFGPRAAKFIPVVWRW